MAFLKSYQLLLIRGIFILNLCLLAILTLPSSTNLIRLPSQKSFTITVFMTICLIGITLGLFPHKYRQLFHPPPHQRGESRKHIEEATTLRIGGHHPLCGKFTSHTFHLNGHIFCAGCTGLVTGAVIALIGCTAYVFANRTMTEVTVYMFWLGFAGICAGILQFHRSFLSHSLIRIVVNALFVLGAFPLLVAVIELQHNLVLETYVLIVLLFSVIIRIMVSQQHHKQICEDCDLKLCFRRFETRIS